MSTIKVKIPNEALVLTNSKYFFRDTEEELRELRIVRKYKYRDIVDIGILNIGFLYFKFLNQGGLASFDRKKFIGSGTVPQSVMADDKKALEVHQNRQTFMNYISAVVFGTISAQSRSGLNGCILVKLDDVFDCFEQGESVLIENNERLGNLIQSKMRSVSAKDFYYNGFKYLDHIGDAILDFQRLEDSCRKLDIRSCVSMNYQAALLHNQQFPAASLILNISALEALVEEFFYIYGIIKNSKVVDDRFLSLIGNLSSNEFQKLTLANRLKFLSDHSIIDRQLYERAENLRKERNNFSHKGHQVRQKSSGECQTVLRDFWKVILHIQFEINAPWSFRL